MTDKETNRDWSEIARPYDNFLKRSISSGDQNLLNEGTPIDKQANTSGNSEVTSNGSVETMPVKNEGSIGDVWITNFIRSKNWKPKKVGFNISGMDGRAEFTNVFVSGEIEALTGTIGGFTITATALYGGIIKTAATVGAGTTGVIMDTDGLRGYDSVLGNTFNLPTDGSAPTFSSGIINETIYEISTNAVLRTSETVGDGTVDSAGILINNTGLYGCEASQTLANANIKALIDGTITLKGSITITGGSGIASLTDAGNLVTVNEADVNALNLTNAPAAANADVTQTIIDGGMITTGYITLGTAGHIKSGQTAYDTGTGWWIGDIGGVPKLSIGNSTGNKMTYDGTDLTMTGGTITGGIIRTASSGARVEMEGTNNTLQLYDAVGSVIKLGSSAGTAMEILLNATTDNGIVTTSTVAGNGFYYTNTGNVACRGIYITQSNVGSSNNLPCVEAKHSGAYYAYYAKAETASGGMIIDQSGTGKGIYLINSGTGLSIDIVHSGDSVGINYTYSGNVKSINLQHSSNDVAIDVVHNGNTFNPTLRLTKNSVGFIESLSTVVNSANYCGGLEFDINNAGAGLEYAFGFAGSEQVSGAVGGTQDKKIRVRIGATTYYIPCYTA